MEPDCTTFRGKSFHWSMVRYLNECNLRFIPQPCLLSLNGCPLVFTFLPSMSKKIITDLAIIEPTSKFVHVNHVLLVAPIYARVGKLGWRSLFLYESRDNSGTPPILNVSQSRCSKDRLMRPAISLALFTLLVICLSNFGSTTVSNDP